MAIKEDFSAAKGSLLAGECAEAAQVFVRWKNIAFTVIILCLLLALLPWQIAFGSMGLGVIYTPDELAKRCTAETSVEWGATLLYLRFTGYWILAVILLLLAQLRSFRWRRTVIGKLDRA